MQKKHFQCYSHSHLHMSFVRPSCHFLKRIVFSVVIYIILLVQVIFLSICKTLYITWPVNKDYSLLFSLVQVQHVFKEDIAEFVQNANIKLCKCIFCSSCSNTHYPIKPLITWLKKISYQWEFLELTIIIIIISILSVYHHQYIMVVMSTHSDPRCILDALSRK